jgi:hypothetical protein
MEEDSMATPERKKKTTKAPKRSRGPSSADARSERFKQISRSSSQIVKDAAVLLDEEIAAGIVAAKQMQQRFQKERRIDPAVFKSLIKKFQSDAHEVVNLFSDQIAELRSKENAELVDSLVRRAHDALDLATEVFVMSADMAAKALQSRLHKKRPARNARRKS